MFWGHLSLHQSSTLPVNLWWRQGVARYTPLPSPRVSLFLLRGWLFQALGALEDCYFKIYYFSELHENSKSSIVLYGNGFFITPPMLLIDKTNSHLVILFVLILYSREWVKMWALTSSSMRLWWLSWRSKQLIFINKWCDTSNVGAYLAIGHRKHFFQAVFICLYMCWNLDSR